MTTTLRAPPVGNATVTLWREFLDSQPGSISAIYRPSHSRVGACRSFFLTPGTRPDTYLAGGAADGDAIIVDLEATVAPEDKEIARRNALGWLRKPASAGSVRIVRINSPRSAGGLRDLLALHEPGIEADAVIIPKCKSAEEIRLVAHVFDGAQSRTGVIPMVEVVRGVLDVDLLAAAHQRVCGLCLGGSDLAAELGIHDSWEDLLFARLRVAAAAATAGIAAIDMPYCKDNGAGFRREATASVELGLTGKATLHPEQLAAINIIFSPSAETVTLRRDHFRSRGQIALRRRCGLRRAGQEA